MVSYTTVSWQTRRIATTARTSVLGLNHSFLIVIRPRTPIAQLMRRPAIPKRRTNGREVAALSTRIREKRVALGLTRRMLADCLGVDLSTLSQWERNSRQPNGHNIELINRWLARSEEGDAVQQSIHGEPIQPSMLGEVIRNRRKELSQSRSEAAASMGVSLTSVTMWEAGKRSPSRRYKRKLVRWLGEEAVRILKGRGSSHNFTDRSLEDGNLPEVPISEIGCHIRRKRKEWGMTQAELSKYLGVSLLSISHWEASKTSPSYPNYRLVCEWLAADITELVDRSSSDAP